MKNVHSIDKKKKLLLFVFSLVILMGLMLILGLSINSSTPIKETDTSTALLVQAGLVISNNEKLQLATANLQQLDKQYAAAITNPSFSTMADSMNTVILLEEKKCKAMIERVAQQQVYIKDKKMATDFEKMIARYQSFLDDRTAMGNMRNVVSLQSNTLAPDDKKILQLQAELMDKSNQIFNLEKSLKNLVKTNTPIVEKTDDNKKLMQSINEMETAIAMLSETNRHLKTENEQLQLQKADGSKKQSSTEQMWKDKNSALQQKIEDLHAEIQLVKVDCNLNRVDASQIISNAKQRKQLLNEASGILMDLAATGNAIVKQRVNEKISRLNRVAANTRE